MAAQDWITFDVVQRPVPLSPTPLAFVQQLHAAYGRLLTGVDVLIRVPVLVDSAGCIGVPVLDVTWIDQARRVRVIAPEPVTWDVRAQEGKFDPYYYRPDLYEVDEYDHATVDLHAWVRAVYGPAGNPAWADRLREICPLVHDKYDTLWQLRLQQVLASDVETTSMRRWRHRQSSEYHRNKMNAIRRDMWELHAEQISRHCEILHEQREKARLFMYHVKGIERIQRDDQSRWTRRYKNELGYWMRDPEWRTMLEAAHIYEYLMTDRYPAWDVAFRIIDDALEIIDGDIYVLDDDMRMWIGTQVKHFMRVPIQFQQMLTTWRWWSECIVVRLEPYSRACAHCEAPLWEAMYSHIGRLAAAQQEPPPRDLLRPQLWYAFGLTRFMHRGRVYEINATKWVHRMAALYRGYGSDEPAKKLKLNRIKCAPGERVGRETAALLKRLPGWQWSVFPTQPYMKVQAGLFDGPLGYSESSGSDESDGE